MLHQFGLGCIKNGALWPIRNVPYVPFRSVDIRYSLTQNISHISATPNISHMSKQSILVWEQHINNLTEKQRHRLIEHLLEGSTKGVLGQGAINEAAETFSCSRYQVSGIWKRYQMPLT